MSDQYCGEPNWFNGGGGGGDGGVIRSSSTSSIATLSSTTGDVAGYGWLTENLTGATKLDTSSLELIGLGLSNTPTIEWNQQYIRNFEKTEHSFTNMLREEIGTNPNFEQEIGGLRQGNMIGDSSEFKQIGGRGFSADQEPQFSPRCNSIESTITCNNTTNNNQGFQLDSSSILQGLMNSDQQNHQEINYQHNYFGMSQFRRASSPKQQLQFTNNAPYWNESLLGIDMNIDVRPSFFASLQTPLQMSASIFEEKHKLQNTKEMRDSNLMTTKNTTSQETNNITKRARSDGATSKLPPFKVRKEKMGDKITTLQQLVSPFGKTDTASVLSEAIEYIKYLHEQVGVLSNPYLKSGAYPFQQQGNEKTKVNQGGPKQDMRSQGLCLVPVSSTIPVTHATTVDQLYNYDIKRKA